MKDLAELIARAEGVLARVEAMLPPPAPDPDWKKVTAARWRKRGGRGYLQPVPHPHAIKLDELVAIDEQKHVIDANTRQFVAGLPANNVLLTGSRGTGKSSLVKAMLAKYASKGLRVIEVDKGDLVDLPDIAERVEGQPQQFIVFCDDLTFDAGEAGYKALKVMLDGSIAGGATNVLIYATSNRRHLLPEYFSENLETKHIGEEVHPGESVEEKISLSERFGLWISFYPFTQDDYLAAVARWLAHFGVKPATGARETEVRTREALQWALQRGSRSGRVAWQFAKNLAGAQALKKITPAVSVVRVAAAVLLRPNGEVLLAQRPPGKPYAGYWEFPGGKLEAGESPRDALVRELHEELGIVVRHAAPWFVQEFVYPHAHVELHFFRVFAWDGELHGHDGQAFAWQTPGRYAVGPLLPANTRILAALELPAIYGITCAADSTEDAFLARAQAALARGLRLVQLRDKEWSLERRLAFARELVPLVHRFGARVLWNGAAEDARSAGCDGVHWTAETLNAATSRPAGMLAAASCHTRDEIARAGALDLDFAVMGPVAATPTHPAAVLLGWRGFADAIAHARLPVFALGGLGPADLDQAVEHGAHGVALRRAAWD